MAQAAKSFTSQDPPGAGLQVLEGTARGRSRKTLFWQIVLIYGLIEGALWTPVGVVNGIFILSAAACVLGFVLRGTFSWQQMGVSRASAAAWGWIALGGMVLAASVPLLSHLVPNNAGPGHVLPLGQAAMYALWALVQQFILQSF